MDSRIENLPPELLEKIFDFCPAFHLARLSLVCTKFYHVIKDNNLWTKRSRRILATNQASKRFRQRCNPELDPQRQWKYSQNWITGRYEEKLVLDYKVKKFHQMRHMALTNDVLWFTNGDKLEAFPRYFYVKVPLKKLKPRKNTGKDICKFVFVDRGHQQGDFICGHRDGYVSFSDIANRTYTTFYNSSKIHDRDVNAVDTMGEMILSGSDDETVKISKFEFVNDYTSIIDDKMTIDVQDKCWSVRGNSHKGILAVGCSGRTDLAPLRIFDGERGVELDLVHSDRRHGDGVLDMVWENPNELLSVGYDSYMRKWDLREGKCVNCWEDPTDSGMYCLSSDYRFSVVTGSQYNSKAVLWDQRQSRCVRMYFLSKHRSPVYSVCFDSCYLFGALDLKLVRFNFSNGKESPPIDSNLYHCYEDLGPD